MRRFFGRAASVRRALVLSVVCASVAPGCATIGRPFPPEPVQQIRLGETTKTQLIGHFGLPYRRGLEDGDSTWTYVHYKYRLFGEKARTRDLLIRFNAEGRVRSYTYSSNMDD